MKRIIALAAALMLLAFTALSAAADMLGDVNGNGAIDAADYAMAKRQCLGTYEMTAEELLRADINGNGAVDPTEYAMIKRHVLGTYTIEGEVETKHEHTPVTDAAVPASCTGTGLTEGSHCSVCGEVIVAQEVVPALGHEPNGNGVCTRCNKDVTSKGLEYRLNNSGDGYIVTGIGTCTDTKIVIPAKYNGLPVVWIGSMAFNGCTSLLSITIPDSVESIDYQAFCGCTSLTSVTIGSGVTSIGDDWMGYDVFVYCDSLERITVDQNNTVYHSTGNCLIETGSKTLVVGCKNSVIPTDGSVTSIGNHAFEGCTGLKSITIPNGVTSIGVWTFRGCTSLKNISIPDSLTIIGSMVFNGCTSLESITIPPSVECIDHHAFEGCTGLTSITIPNSVTSIGVRAFYDCTSLESVTIGNGVTSIGDSAFNGCTSLESITVDKNNTAYHSAGNCLIKTGTKALFLGCANSIIPADGSVTSIEGSAFEGCTGLTSITIPNSVRSIGVWTFKGCTSLKNITIPNSVTYLAGGTFRGCTSLESVTIPNSVTSISASDFEGCASLESITVDKNNTAYHSVGNCLIETGSKKLIAGCKNSIIPTDGSVTSIGSSAFEGRTGLTSITIPNSVTWIGGYAFDECTSLESITIPDSVTWIGSCAFYECTSLESITIPNSVTYIGKWAFNKCTSLSTVYYTGTKAQWEAIEIGEKNDALQNATIVFNYKP